MIQAKYLAGNDSFSREEGIDQPDDYKHNDKGCRLNLKDFWVQQGTQFHGAIYVYALLSLLAYSSFMRIHELHIYVHIYKLERITYPRKDD